MRYIRNPKLEIPFDPSAEGLRAGSTNSKSPNSESQNGHGMPCRYNVFRIGRDDDGSGHGFFATLRMTEKGMPGNFG
jgi:hypothetical protein